ncbi:mycothione reductase [Kytococcus sedentarius]|uniref:mycothione reductase n=1 Tax=Kytococcus sedentarius TaxID=1276 RepID=UPI0035BC2D1E
MSAEHYDLVIIGSGSGNSVPQSDHADLRVAVVEGGVFGGTCLNNGCIPTKMFVWAAGIADTVRDSERFGIDAELRRVRWQDVRDRVFERIDPISIGGAEYRRASEGTDLYEGWARFTGEREIEVDLAEGGTAHLTADQVVIATGSAPFVPPALEPLMDSVAHTNRSIMRLEELPEHLTIVGGGVVAVEFAHIFGSLGSRVTLLVRGQQLLKGLPEELNERFAEIATRTWDVRFGTEVASAREQDGGAVLELGDGTTLRTDCVLVATGRRPNTPALGLDAAGVETDEHGFVVTDTHGRTSAPGVWALGDVRDPVMLKHVANAQARVVSHNLTHPDDLREFPTVPVVAGVFSHPEIGVVGMTPQEARDAGHRVVCHEQEYASVAYGWAMEDTQGRCGVVADAQTGAVLGGWVMGHQAATLVNLLGEAVLSGEHAHAWARGRYWPHPALSEVVENALLSLELDAPQDPTT